jgi:branched-chain amino acid transport system ATP-binding protein
VLISVTDCFVRYGPVEALSGVSLEVGTGELVALVGANGAGKTTLIGAISGLRPLHSGRLHFSGTDITHRSAAFRVALGICQSPEGRLVFQNLSVDENLLMGAYTRRDREVDKDRESVYALFPALKAKSRQFAGLLSGGQQQMLAIGRALMARPKLLLLDEPSMGLSPLLVAEIFEKIVQLRKTTQVSILLVEQNANIALKISDRSYVLERGKIVHSGKSSTLLGDPILRKAYLGI